MNYTLTAVRSHVVPVDFDSCSVVAHQVVRDGVACFVYSYSLKPGNTPQVYPLLCLAALVGLQELFQKQQVPFDCW